MTKRIKTKEDIDWSVFQRGDETNVYCRCGGRYSSLVKSIWVAESEFQTFSHHPCPKCGRDDNVYRATDDDRDWEEVTITKDDVGVLDVDDLLK